MATSRNSSVPKGYSALLVEVKARVQSAQYAALRAVNQELMSLYWDIGKMIVARQENAGWGKAVVEQLAVDLQPDFPGAGGVSASNLWRMKRFFETYGSIPKLAPLVREIGWSHNLIILERCEDALERELYLHQMADARWLSIFGYAGGWVVGVIASATANAAGEEQSNV